MKKGTFLGTIVGAALLAAAPSRFNGRKRL